jgi:hypothetical protein
MANEKWNQSDQSRVEENRGEENRKPVDSESTSTPGATDQQPPATGERSSDNHPSGRSWMIPGVIGVLVGILMLIVGFGGGWVAAEMTDFSVVRQQERETQTQVTDGNQLEVPPEAEVINECAEGRGKQYVLSENLPKGPVYGVWNGEITSVEYMLGKEEFLGGQDFTNLDLMNARYDHVDVGLLSEGHSGYPEPHYHVDLYTISDEKSQQITCE